jgi:LysM repeat protein
MASVDRRTLIVLISGALGTLLLAMIAVTVLSLGGAGSDAAAERSGDRATRPLAAYWTVRRGDSYASIAQRTGLTIDELETFNRYVNPSAIVPGQRLKLRLHPPRPKPRPLGPRTYRVRAGDSFAAIARRFHHSVARLQQRNPKLPAADLRPGDRVRLR